MEASCTICHANIDPDTGHATLSCNHTFHLLCITRWLKAHESCPQCQPEAGSEETEEADVERCAICLTDITESTGKEDGLATLSCKHSFHLRCITKWLNTHETCPLCRDKGTDTGLDRTTGPGPGPCPGTGHYSSYVITTQPQQTAPMATTRVYRTSTARWLAGLPCCLASPLIGLLAGTRVVIGQIASSPTERTCLIFPFTWPLLCLCHYIPVTLCSTCMSPFFACQYMWNENDPMNLCSALTDEVAGITADCWGDQDS